MSVTINGTNGLTFADNSSQTTAATGFGFKNRIINGAMMIDQRNAGASVTANDGTFGVDRFAMWAFQNGKGTLQQNAGSVTPPAGFINYLGFTSSSAYTPASTESFAITQNIEGLNVADLGWGGAGAATVTLSFWVRSSLTGTFGGALSNSVRNRSYPFSFTISAANTWEQKSITVVGDTTGTWLTTNGIGLRVFFNLGSGSSKSGTANTWQAADVQAPTGATSLVGTSGATFYITGVQLEKGSTATSFDYRPYGAELALCWRYYRKTDVAAYGEGSMYQYNSAYNSTGFSVPLPVQMRVAPTATVAGTWSRVNSNNNGPNCDCSRNSVFFYAETPSGGFFAIGSNNSGYITYSAEL